MKRTVSEKVNKYIQKHPNAGKLLITDMNEIVGLGSVWEIVTTAFAYGYMKGSRARKGGVS